MTPEPVTTASNPTIVLDDGFLRALPEMAIPWRAAQAPDPRLVTLNEPLAATLGLDATWLRSPDGVRFLVGNVVPDGANPVAQAYSGHQFGGFQPRLGDGRALLLGELGGRELHLKGSGRTPFARGGDGLAAVGPMLREYVISEAMHALGIPTSRSLAVVATGQPVYRDTELPGAVLARIANSHLRVGSFQYAAASGDTDLLRRLAEYAITRHYPAAAAADNQALALFEAVVAAQAALIARWMLVGFVHGVMNTDNMTISGATIDYGPCAFMDAFDPATVFSSIDHGGRYAYGNQPAVAAWNLARLAEAMLPLFDDDQDRAIALGTESLRGFGARYEAAWLTGMRKKLGLTGKLPDDELLSMVEELVAMLTEHQVDYTSFFRALAAGDVTGFDAWVAHWADYGPDRAAMNRVNPIYIPRNHLVEEALAAATAGELAPQQRLLTAVTAPYEELPGFERYAEPAPDEFGCYQTFCGT